MCHVSIITTYRRILFIDCKRSVNINWLVIITRKFLMTNSCNRSFMYSLRPVCHITQTLYFKLKFFSKQFLLFFINLIVGWKILNFFQTWYYQTFCKLCAEDNNWRIWSLSEFWLTEGSPFIYFLTLGPSNSGYFVG